MPTMPQPPRRLSLALASTVAAALLSFPLGGATLGQDALEPEPISGELTVYTSVTQDTVDAALAALAAVHPDLAVEVFRAPTGELDARIAAERRTGGIGADVLWLTDPLSLQTYEADGLLAPLGGEAFEAVPAAFRGDTFVGTRLLNLVLVAGADVEPQPIAWADLVDPAYAGGVAMPDPGFAGSAFAALGYFATSEGYGVEFYQALADNGAVLMQAPIDTLTSVAEGVHQVGITLDKLARDAIADGAPVELIWPEPGAIALFSPVAVVAGSAHETAAQAFAAFHVSHEGQAAIASTGWQPVRDDVEWPYEGAAVSVDWAQLYGNQKQLLGDFYAIFGE
jgi:iron(III) transport system substrate-binding protein